MSTAIVLVAIVLEYSVLVASGRGRRRREGMRMPVQHLLLLIYAGLPWGTPCRTGDDAHDAIVVPEKRTMACGG